jgi:GNAT superfamily N-acetyltransferase
VLEDRAARVALAERASSIVDGLGAWRVVRAWEQLVGSPPAPPSDDMVQLNLRAASMNDAKTLWRWRNDPGTRAASRHSAELPFEDHLGWLERSLATDERILLLASDQTGDVGTVRWDLLRKGEWEVSITVAPERRGQSLGGALLRAAERELVLLRGAPVTSIAGVHEGNVASRRLFESAGYLLDLPADGDGFVTFVKHVSPNH